MHISSVRHDSLLSETALEYRRTSFRLAEICALHQHFGGLILPYKQAYYFHVTILMHRLKCSRSKGIEQCPLEQGTSDSCIAMAVMQ